MCRYAQFRFHSAIKLPRIPAYFPKKSAAAQQKTAKAAAGKIYSTQSLESLQRELPLFLGIFLVSAFNSCVIFDLRLGSGRTHANPGLVFQLEIEHVGLRQSQLGGLSGSNVGANAGTVIFHSKHFEGAYALRGVGAEALHQSVDLCFSFHSLEGLGDQVLFVIAIGLVEVLHLLAEGKTFGLIVSGCFAESHNGNNGVLVSCVGSFQAAVALLVTEEELMAVILLEELDLLADVFETGQSLRSGLRCKPLRSPGHFSGHDGW